jgi:hypothetical protein
METIEILPLNKGQKSRYSFRYDGFRPRDSDYRQGCRSHKGQFERNLADIRYRRRALLIEDQDGIPIPQSYPIG